MTNKKDIRWRQRFENFEKAYKLLERTLQINNPSEAEKGGIIQFYEMAFELAWKMLKDYLEAEGLHTQSPREVLKTAYQYEFITNGHEWIDALDDRNLTVHTYDEKMADQVVEKIKYSYFNLLKNLYQSFREKKD
jgi:nucleotidyltransferase substrate binding protein (TIGR01987 family)